MELYILLFFMILGAVIAIEIKDLFSSIIAVGAVGFVLCTAFLILKAPDLAITQLVVEILCLVILVRATVRKDLPLVIEGRWFFNTASTIFFIAVFLFAAYQALRELPAFGKPIMYIARTYLEEGLKRTGAANLVSAVTLDFRAYDTLGEIAVLFAAVVGVMVVLRRSGKAKQQEQEPKNEKYSRSGMSLIVKGITRLTASFILLFGIYIVLHGHISPGGGFAGGVIIVLSFVLIMLAFGKEAAVNKVFKNFAGNLEGIGALMFLIIALLGFFGGSFFLNILNKGTPFKLFSGGIIPLENLAIALKTGIGVFAIFLVLVILEGAKRKK